MSLNCVFSPEHGPGTRLTAEPRRTWRQDCNRHRAPSNLIAYRQHHGHQVRRRHVRPVWPAAVTRFGGVHHRLRIVYGPDAQAVGRQERQVEVTETVRRLGEFRDVQYPHRRRRACAGLTGSPRPRRQDHAYSCSPHSRMRKRARVSPAAASKSDAHCMPRACRSRLVSPFRPYSDRVRRWPRQA